MKEKKEYLVKRKIGMATFEELEQHDFSYWNKRSAQENLEIMYQIIQFGLHLNGIDYANLKLKKVIGTYDSQVKNGYAK